MREPAAARFGNFHALQSCPEDVRDGRPRSAAGKIRGEADAPQGPREVFIFLRTVVARHPDGAFGAPPALVEAARLCERPRRHHLRPDQYAEAGQLAAYLRISASEID